MSADGFISDEVLLAAVRLADARENAVVPDGETEVLQEEMKAALAFAGMDVSGTETLTLLDGILGDAWNRGMARLEETGEVRELMAEVKGAGLAVFFLGYYVREVQAQRGLR